MPVELDPAELIEGLGTPGFPLGGVVSVQGVPSGTPQPVTVTNPTTAPETGLAKETTLQAVRDRADFPDAGVATRLGEVSATPTANTVLARLQSLGL